MVLGGVIGGYTNSGKKLKDFLQAEEEYFRNTWGEVKKQLRLTYSFAREPFRRPAHEQCKALVNFYVYYILGKKQWLGWR